MLGLVGESGSGKTTVGYCIDRLLEPTAGTIRLDGADITHLSRSELRPFRRRMHIVFQDPYSSLNPRMTCGQIVGEPIRLHRLARRAKLETRVAELFDSVGLRPELRYRDPHDAVGRAASAGRARARAERRPLPTDRGRAGVRARRLRAGVRPELLRDLQRHLGFSCLFISHDLATVEFLCDRVAVMYLGKIVELAPGDELFARPQHPYTQALLSAALVPGPVVQRTRSRIVLAGDIPTPLAPPSGCRFRIRCPLEPGSAPRSTEEEPPLVDVTGRGHLVACHLVRRGAEAPRLADAPTELARAGER